MYSRTGIRFKESAEGNAGQSKPWRKAVQNTQMEDHCCPDSNNDKQGKWRRQKRTRSSNSRGDEAVPHKKRPNYFVAVQVSNPEIHAVAKKVQMGIQETSKQDLGRALIRTETMHITLMVMHLQNEEDILRARGCLDRCIPVIAEMTCGQPVSLEFEGLDVFNGGRVLFASPKQCQGLDHLHFMADEVAKQMGDVGIFTTDGAGRKFNPHLTLIKFGEKAPKGIRKVSKEHYLPFTKEIFGSQDVCSLQLCSMTEKRDDGYYFVSHEAFFHKPMTEVD